MNFVSGCKWSWSVHKSFRPLTVLKPALKRCIYNSSSAIRFAQPTSSSHPHLLKEEEVTPGAIVEVYQQRRQKLIERILKSSHKHNAAHLIVIPSASTVYMTESIPYTFRQNSDFLYISGFKEPNSTFIVEVLPESATSKCTLFMQKPSTHSIRWEGPKMDLQTLTAFLGIEQALYLQDLENYLHTFGKSHTKLVLWYDYLTQRPSTFHQTLTDFVAKLTGSISVESPRAILHQMRLIKTKEEVELMRKTCKIGGESLKEVMKFSRPGMLEMHLQAKMDFECRTRGADFLSFPPVVAGGDRANTIHYIENNNVVNDTEMVLMDAGCECHGYSSDITRTWPVNGKFTDPQREVYELVLSVQEDLIEICKTRIPLDDLFQIMCNKLGMGLQELGIISKSFSKEEVSKVAYKFCPHHVGHYLGMDVHDTNLISRAIRLHPGMVVTVEPGIYIPKDDAKVPNKYRGLCVRIEDDVLITEDGCVNLTSCCPKHVDEIEKLLSLN